MMRDFRPVVVPLAVLSLTLASCDQKPKTAGAGSKATPAAAKKKGPPVDVQFDKARALLMEGKFAEAAEAFKEAGSDPKTKQPLYNWIAVLEGASLLLDGREPESRKVFEALAARGLYSEKPTEEKMAKFFVDVGQALSGDTAIPADKAEAFDKWTHEGIVYLLYALKDWNLENFEEAVPLFRRFADVQPEKRTAWAEGPDDLKLFQDIAKNCVDDYLTGRPALQELSSATTPEDQLQAINKAKAARAKMKLVTKTSKDLDAKIAELSPKVASAMNQRAKEIADETEADAKALPIAKQKRVELQARFQFAEAKQAIMDPDFKTEKAKDEQQLLIKKSSWLANFKDQLIEDINAKGYNQPVNTRKGQPIGTGIAKADQQGLMTNTIRGPVQVPWTDLTPDAIYVMAQSFILPDQAPQIQAFRKWHLGVYASYIGKSESAGLLKEAADIRSLFAEELPIFAKPSNPW